jgi:hypothetical protein
MAPNQARECFDIAGDDGGNQFRIRGSLHK